MDIGRKPSIIGWGAEPDKTAVARPMIGVTHSLKKKYNLDSDDDVEEFLREMQKNLLVRDAFLKRMAEIKAAADKGHGTAQNTYQSVQDALRKEDPMGLRREGYLKGKALEDMYGVGD